jgi:hypothetical protein
MSYASQVIRQWQRQKFKDSPEWQRLNEIAGTIWRTGLPLTHASLEVIAPQLSPESRKALIHPSSRRRFFGPTLWAGDTARVYSIGHAARSADPVVYFDGAWRRSASEGVVTDAERYDLNCAINSAEYLWGDRLVDPIWQNVMQFDLRQPDTHIAKRRVWAVMGAEPGALTKPGWGRLRPREVEVEMDIIWVVSDPLIGREMLGGMLPELYCFCMLCGGGIVAGRCMACGTRFRYADNDWPETDFPLPASTVLEFMLAGYRFETEPLLARKSHYRQWAAEQLPPNYEIRAREQRSIDL